MWALGVCWVLLGILGTGSPQLLFAPAKPVILDPCNESVTLPCIVTNLKLNITKVMFVKWRLEGKEFFSFDGYDSKIYRNNTFQSAALLNVEKLPQGVASLTLSRSEAVEGNYTCEVVESNREGEHIVELKHAGGSCGTEDGVGPYEAADGVGPCGTEDGVGEISTPLSTSFDAKTKKNNQNDSPKFAPFEYETDTWLLGLEFCCWEVSNGKEDVALFEHNKFFQLILIDVWLQLWEKIVIVIAMLVAAVLYWLQLIVVALKFDMTLLKRICLGCAGLIITVAAVTGSILLMRAGQQKVGLGLLVVPAAALVPLLYILLTSVFEKLPYFAVILIVLKAIGYLIALTGYALCASACLAKQSAAVISGIVIIDNVAAITMIYVTIVGANTKDHQLPRKAVEEPLNAREVR